MARARNIKPGLAANAELAECSIWARYLFALLPTIADREGRLEDRPKQIKGELLRFDDQPVDPLLSELSERRFIIRYQNSSGRWIQITKFWKHQSPHYSEKTSVIKPPSFQEWPSHERPEGPGNCSNEVASSTGLFREHSENQPPIKSGSQPPDSLIPDSLIPESKPSGKNGSAVLPDCPQQELIALYGKHLPTLTQPRLWDGKRAEAMRARWRACAKANGVWPGYHTAEEGIAFWDKFFSGVAQSKTLTEGIKRQDGSFWKPDLLWLLKAENFAKVIEGRYHT